MRSRLVDGAAIALLGAACSGEPAAPPPRPAPAEARSAVPDRAKVDPLKGPMRDLDGASKRLVHVAKSKRWSELVKLGHRLHPIRHVHTQDGATGQPASIDVADAAGFSKRMEAAEFEPLQLIKRFADEIGEDDGPARLALEPGADAFSYEGRDATWGIRFGFDDGPKGLVLGRIETWSGVAAGGEASPEVAATGEAPKPTASGGPPPKPVAKPQD